MVRSRENPCLLSTRSVTKWMVQFRLDPMLHACKPSHIHLQHPPTIIQHAACRRPSTTLRTPRKQWKDGRTVGDSNVGWSFYTHTYKPLWQKISLLEWLHMSLYFNHKMHGPYFILVNCFHPCHSRPFQAWSERLKRKRRNEKRHWPKRQRNRNRRKWMMPKIIWSGAGGGGIWPWSVWRGRVVILTYWQYVLFDMCKACVLYQMIRHA